MIAFWRICSGRPRIWSKCSSPQTVLFMFHKQEIWIPTTKYINKQTNKHVNKQTNKRVRASTYQWLRFTQSKEYYSFWQHFLRIHGTLAIQHLKYTFRVLRVPKTVVPSILSCVIRAPTLVREHAPALGLISYIIGVWPLQSHSLASTTPDSHSPRTTLPTAWRRTDLPHNGRVVLLTNTRGLRQANSDDFLTTTETGREQAKAPRGVSLKCILGVLFICFRALLCTSRDTQVRIYWRHRNDGARTTLSEASAGCPCDLLYFVVRFEKNITTRTMIKW